MLKNKSNPSDIEYHIEQMKVLLISDEENKVIEDVLILDTLTKNKEVLSFIQKQLDSDAWSYDTQVLINNCKKKKEKNMIIVNHIKECYNFMIFRYLEEKIVNFPEIIVSKEGNHKSYKWIFTCYSRHEGDDPVRWANMKLNRALDESTATSMFEMLQDDREQVLINEKWLANNRQSFYSMDIFEDTNTLIMKKERDRLNSQLVNVAPMVPIITEDLPEVSQEFDNQNQYVPEDDFPEDEIVYLS